MFPQFKRHVLFKSLFKINIKKNQRKNWEIKINREINSRKKISYEVVGCIRHGCDGMMGSNSPHVQGMLHILIN